MKKKLLFVVDNLVMGGVTRVLVNLLNNLDYEKYQADLLILHYYEDTEISLPEQVTIIKGDNTYKYIDRTIGSIISSRDLKALCGKLSLVLALKSGFIKKLIRRSRKKMLTSCYDTEIAFNDGFTQIFVSQGNSKRKVGWLHSDISVFNDSARYKTLIEESLKKMDAVVCVSSQVKAAYVQQYNIKNACVIHNIMDADKILKNAESPVVLPFDADHINLISVGRLCEAKNYFRFIRVHKMLLDSGYPVHSYIIGDGSDREMLEKEIADNGVCDSFTLLGRMENPFPFVKGADIFVLSSNHEGLPTVLFEALILGTPCVSTKVAGAPEILGDRYGILSEKSDEALFTALKEMLIKENLDSYRLAASNYQYSANSIIMQIEDIL